LLLDLGQGSFPRLTGAIEPSRLSGVLISHLHPDHFIDLVALRHYLRWEFDPPRHVRVIAADGLAERIDALHAEPGFTAASLDVEPLAEGDLTVGGLGIVARRVMHTSNSYGFRVSAGPGPALVYSGDCGRADDLEPLIEPGDTLLVEVSFGAGPVRAGALHLDGPAIGRLATECEVGTVLLTHLQMGYDPQAALDSVRKRFPGPVSLVAPGERFTIGG
jgi:ribonuclease BN (tRNA processing enzyme)